MNCYATGNVKGRDNVGGLVGDGRNLHGVTIMNCYTTGNVIGDGGNIGGIAGNYTSDTLSNCVALNPIISGIGFTRRIIGYNSNSLMNNYARSDTFINGSTIISTNANSQDGSDITSILSAIRCSCLSIWEERFAMLDHLSASSLVFAFFAFLRARFVE